MQVNYMCEVFTPGVPLFYTSVQHAQTRANYTGPTEVTASAAPKANATHPAARRAANSIVFISDAEIGNVVTLSF